MFSAAVTKDDSKKQLKMKMKKQTQQMLESTNRKTETKEIQFPDVR